MSSSSTLSAERLYRLLPQVHRLRDADQGYPLRELLTLFAAEVEAIEENIAQLYDDQFIETCADWVAPYIGDLIGYRPLLQDASPALGSPRAEVANTIAMRRRKGTALMLEQLARDVTGWPAHATEFFEQLATTQYMNHIRAQALATADTRSLAGMLAVPRERDGDLNHGAFNRAAHTAEMRAPEVSRNGSSGGGRFNIPNVGLFLWRLQHFALSGVPLVADPADATGSRWRLNPLGCDTALFRRPRVEASISELSSAVNVPAPLTVRGVALAPADDLGAGRSITLLRPPAAPGSPWVPVPPTEIVIADLRDDPGAPGSWNHEAGLPANRIAIDPERGRVLLGSGVPRAPLRATFHTGFSRAIGGGEYERTPSGEGLAAQRRARESEALAPHLTAIQGSGRLLIEDSLTYAQTPTIRITGVTAAGAAGNEVVVAAADGARPLVAAAGPVVLDVGARGRLVLEGLVFSGGPLTLAAAADTEPREIVLRDCTLVPGLSLNADGGAVSPGAPSLVVAHPFAKVTLERCITGPLRVATEAEVELRDCIVDAGSASAIAFEGSAAATPGAPLTVQDSTLVGKVHAQMFTLASNTLMVARRVALDGFRAPVWAERTQEGCVRFCWLPPDSITPRRHRCLPDAANPGVLPQFTALHYTHPGYMQLRGTTPRVIRTGADDEGEIGVMHALMQPQREANLRVRLQEYLRFGLSAGVFHAT